MSVFVKQMGNLMQLWLVKSNPAWLSLWHILEKQLFRSVAMLAKIFSNSLKPSKSPPQEFVESLNFTLVGREYIRFLRNCMIFLQWCKVSFLIFELWFAYINRAAEARNRIRLTRLRYQNNRVRWRQKKSFLTLYLFIATAWFCKINNGETF